MNLSIIMAIFAIVRDGLKMIINIDHSRFMNNTVSGSWVLRTENTSVSISQSEFVFNSGLLTTVDGTITNIDHSKFMNNTGLSILNASNTNIVSITHSEFVDNTAIEWLIFLDGVMITVKLNEFINNRASFVMVEIRYTSVRATTLTNNVFINNSEAYEIFVNSNCRPGLCLSLGSPRCIECSDHWHQNLIGIVVAAFIAGIALVIFILS